jgi:hypothetical protein
LTDFVFVLVPSEHLADLPVGRACTPAPCLKEKNKLHATMFCDAESAALPLERCMRVLPHQDDTGGFFIAVMEKVADMPADLEPPKKLRGPITVRTDLTVVDDSVKVTFTLCNLFELREERAALAANGGEGVRATCRFPGVSVIGSNSVLAGNLTLRFRSHTLWYLKRRGGSVPSWPVRCAPPPRVTHHTAGLWLSHRRVYTRRLIGCQLLMDWVTRIFL